MAYSFFKLCNIHCRARYESCVKVLFEIVPDDIQLLFAEKEKNMIRTLSNTFYSGFVKSECDKFDDKKASMSENQRKKQNYLSKISLLRRKCFTKN